MEHKWFNLKRSAVVIVLTCISTLLLGACGENTPTSAPAPTVAATTVATSTATSAVTTVSTTQAVKTVAPIPNGDRTGVTDTEIRLGASGPITGSIGFLGTPIRVIDAYFKMINEQGGIYGRKIKYIIEDDGFDRVKSLAAVKKLIDEDQVLALTGVRSPSVVELRDYLAQRKMPSLPLITSSTQLYEPAQKFVFGFLPPVGPEAKFAVDYATEQLGAKKLAIVYQTDSIGIDALKPFVTEAQVKQVPVVAQVTIKNTDQDVVSQLATLQQSGTDFIYLAGNTGQVVTLLKEIDNWANKPKIMISYYLSDLSFYQPLGKAAEGMYSTWFALPPESDDVKSVQFREFMRKYMPNEPTGYYAQEGYIMAQVIVEALRRAGKDLSRESLVAGAESIINWRESYANNITFGPINRSPISSFYVTQYQNSKIQKVSDWFTLK